MNDDEKQPEESDEMSQAGLPRDLEGATVLVIDDEPPVVNFVTDYFEARGATVVQALDGEAGLEAFRQNVPDLVMSDLLLPKCNGFALIEELEATAPSMPVIVMSGIYKGERYRDELSHARLYFDKPLNMSELDEAAQLLLAGLENKTERAPVASEMNQIRAKEPWIPTALLPLAKVLSLLWKENRSGLLTHRAGDLQTVFTIVEGQVRFVRCNDPELALGRLLPGLGQASAEQVEQATAELKALTEPTRLGTVLVRQGVLSEDDLAKAIRVQLRKIISTAFSRVDSETLFRSGTDESAEDIVIEASMPTLLMAGCAVMDDESPYLLGHLPDADTLLEMDPRAEGLVAKLPPTESGLLSTITEPTRLSDIASMARLVGLRPRRLLFGLLCAQVLTISAADDEQWVYHHPLAVGDSENIDVETAPPTTLIRLANDLATGMLTVKHGETTSWLWLENGLVRGAGSDDAHHQLGERLRESGLVDESRLKEALTKREATPNKCLGRILVEQGSLDAAHLLHALKAQVLTIAKDVVGLTSWDQACFEEGRPLEEEPVDLGVSTPDVILGAMRDASWNDVVQLVGSLAEGRPKLELKALRRRFTLNEAEKVVADAVSGRTADFMQAIDEGDSDADVLRVLAAALLVTPASEPAVQ